ncbi:hypothetical protein [Methylobacterium sp. E-045]|uniref:hypothetical protein n=1 Tax=Methylobacterium sp. E-045 TaxID=2836575 RepID=UPI001FBB43F0|nr:hypothetical protein [Methylobacterium sp. E-045]
MPPATLKGNGGLEASAPADLTAEEAREVIGLDHVANKSEEEMVASGPISDAFTQVAEALATKATPIDIADAIAPISQALSAKASTHYVDQQIGIVGQSVTDLAEDVADVQAQVTAIASGQSSGAIIAKSWAALAAVPPAAAGGRAEVIGTATTTHPDPVAAGNPAVLDPGTYRGSLSPLGWERIGPTTAAAAAAQIGSGAAIVPTLTDTATVLIFAADGVTPQRLTGASLKTLIEEVAVPRLYPQEISGVVVTNASRPILTADEFRRGDVSIQVVGAGDIGARWGGGGPAAFNDNDTWLQKAGQWVNHPNPGTGPLSLIGRRAEGDASPVSLSVRIRVQRTVNAPPTFVGPADTIFSLWKDPADPRYTAVIRQEVQYLIDNNIYGLIKGWWMPGASKENFRVNLANPNGPLLTYNEGTGSTPIAFRPYIGVKGNGTDQHASTGILPADVGMTASDHLLMGRAVSTTEFDAGQMVGNDGTLFLQPNRGAQLYGTRSGPGTDTNVATPKPLGKWAALSRDSDPANYNTYIDGDFVETKARVLASMVPRQFNILAGSGVTGVASRSTIETGGVIIGRGLAGISITRLTNSMKRIDAVCAQIAGA